MRDSVYLDYAATAPLHPEAAAAVLAAQGLIGNPSSAHSAGLAAADALSAARSSIALLMGVDADDVVLTSGGSESNTMALWGTFAARGFSGHLVTTSIEHSSVLENARALEELGVEVTFVEPGPTGHVIADDIAAVLRPSTALVSVMHANNETGAIQPIERIAEITRDAGVPLHVDAVQTAGKMGIAGLGAQLVSISGHKFGAPRGVGALAVDRGCRLSPIIRGGSQEHGRRAGTENVAGAMGMAAAAQVSVARLSPVRRAAARATRDRLIDGLRIIGGVHLNSVDPVLKETISIRFDGVRADALADALDIQGIYVSTGSACHAHEDVVSHVLSAQGLTEEEARSSVRLSFGADLSIEDIDHVVTVAVSAVERLRRTAGRAAALR